MLRVEKLCKSFGSFSLKDVSFEVGRGDYFIVLGPSGAGKSIVLEIIAGLIRADSGSIMLNGEDLLAKTIQQRNVGLVFQDLALFPHLSVRHNIAYPLVRKGYSRSNVTRKVIELANKFSISHLLRRYPVTLSGGEQQRVALARTLALEPEILLLDEPLSSLDVELRADVRVLLRNLNRNGQTIIHVTHDFEEAIALANRIAVMKDGVIEQTGTPQEVFSKPMSSFVAEFGGIRNFFSASVDTVSNSDISEAKLKGNIKIYLHSNEQGNGYVTFPENSVLISTQSFPTSAMNCFRGKITDFYPQKLGIEVVVDIGVPVYALVSTDSIRRLELEIGKEVWISFKASSVRFIAK